MSNELFNSTRVRKFDTSINVKSHSTMTKYIIELFPEFMHPDMEFASLSDYVFAAEFDGDPDAEVKRFFDKVKELHLAEEIDEVEFMNTFLLSAHFHSDSRVSNETWSGIALRVHTLEQFWTRLNEVQN